MILLINVGFAYTPFFMIFGAKASLMDPVAGVVYLVRDFAQRELGHRVFYAMAVGAILSYFLSTPTIAYASVVSRESVRIALTYAALSMVVICVQLI